MQPLAIVEPFNERKDLPARVVSGAIPLVMYQLILEDAEETFRHRIIVAVSFTAHAWRQPQCRELPLIRQGTVLGAPIRVMDEARLNASLVHRHGQGLQRELLVRLGAHGPPDHPPRIQIQEHGHIEPTRLRRHRRDIAHPDPIEAGRHKALLQHIGRRRRQVMPFHADAEPADAPCFQARECSEACHTMPPTRHPGLRQGLP